MALDDKKIPDFFSNRAQIQSDEEENVAKTEPKMPVFDVETQFSEEMDEVPYDFRTEYKDRIEQTFANDEENERKFSSVRLHAIGIGVLIGVLIALLFSIFLFTEKADDLEQTIVVQESQRPVKVRPTNPGGMDIPDQDKTIYSRLRTDKIEEPVVEHLNISEETPVRPQAPTKEGQILGTPRVMPETADEMELEVLSMQQKALEAPVSKKPTVVEKAKVEAPVSAPVEKPQASKASAPTVKPAPVAKKQETAKKTQADTWKVQLISLPSKAGAQKAWPQILKKNSALLTGLEHDVSEVQIKGKGTFYRLRVGAFKNRKDAQDLCNKLKSRKQDCTLTK